MNIKDLKWFQEICRLKSITKAAANLYITPQGLSKSIKNLENELGVELLQRTPNGITLTPFGDKLYEKSSVLIKDHEDMLYEMEMLKQQESGLIRLCSAYGVFRILGIDFVLNFEGEIPGATAVECGNFSEQNLSMAKYYIARYKESLEKDKNFEYKV